LIGQFVTELVGQALSIDKSGVVVHGDTDSLTIEKTVQAATEFDDWSVLS
jgi:hypothetical protein